MIKKILIPILIVCFILGIGVLVVAYKTKSIPVGVSLSLPEPTVTAEPEPTAVIPLDPYLQKGEAIIDDLKKIQEDLQKLKQEDTRFFPPEFIFEKDIPE